MCHIFGKKNRKFNGLVCDENTRLDEYKNRSRVGLN